VKFQPQGLQQVRCARRGVLIPEPHVEVPSQPDQVRIQFFDDLAAKHVCVETRRTSSWVNYSQKTVVLVQLKASEVKSASFSFAIDKLAVANRDSDIHHCIEVG
jgi:hypothetical protein